jgi:hypothetical protein
MTTQRQRTWVVLLIEPDVVHQVSRVDEHDYRLSWTVCGIRFAWDFTPAQRPAGAHECPDCWRSVVPHG